MKKLILTLFLIVCSSIAYSQIFEIKKFEEIKNHLTPDSLILLDIDDTLILPVQMLGSDVWFEHRLQHLLDNGMAKDAALPQAVDEWCFLRLLSDMELIEQNTPQVLLNLQKLKYPIMGLTIQRIQLCDKTPRHLLQNGIALEKTAPYGTDLYFPEPNRTFYHKGILFTCGGNKGQALFSFLRRIGYSPKRIVFVDDKENNLRELEKEAEKQNILFVGLRYAGADSRKTAFDKKVADYQFKNSSLRDLISDAEARKSLK